MMLRNWKDTIGLLWLSWHAQQCLSTAPQKVNWSNQTFGPDGPWPAIQMTLGDGQQIATYPGGAIDRTYVITKAYCDNNNGTPCYAEKAGLYQRARASGAGSTFNESSTSSSFTDGLDMKVTHPWVSWFDDVQLTESAHTIDNIWLALVDDGVVKFPGDGDDDTYPLSVGCLSMGDQGKPTNAHENGTGTTIGAGLRKAGLTTSNFFGLHLGSAAAGAGPEPSMYFGGYDRSRVLGDILTARGEFGPVVLLDLSIDVVEGFSPFAFAFAGGARRAAGLLAENSTVGASLNVSVDPCAPYLALPRSSCDAVARWLPVAYDERLALYLWDTADPWYAKIVGSASALTFTFASGGGSDSSNSNSNVSISVPFSHLNLTLEAPLLVSDGDGDTQTTYFPCHPQSDSFSLGRAFLQDAFVAQDYYKYLDPPFGEFYMAQAPGPGIAAVAADPREISSVGIASSALDWAATWSGAWTALSQAEAWNATSGDGGNDGSQESGVVSGGAIAGIVVGCVAGIAILAAAAVFFFLRKKKKRLSQQQQSATQEMATAAAAAGVSPPGGNNYSYPDPSAASHTPGSGVYGGSGGTPNKSPAVSADQQQGRTPVSELQAAREPTELDSRSRDVVYHEIGTGYSR
ncbi:aspartic peptidase domain-containing protein [Xylariomycetidae sp. FL2044]|nr:aspartic peptidase domain-containing protein [Xylariomycetidae sp. FL2044]